MNFIADFLEAILKWIIFFGILSICKHLKENF
jgi:hypothetical protein